MTAPILDYDRALAYLYARVDFERLAPSGFRHSDFKLERMSRLLAEIGHPEREFPAVHIAGTKGKGSTSTMIAAALTAAGRRTGLFTSPHLVRFEERIRVDGEPIPEAAVVRLVTELASAIERIAPVQPHEFPTFFEMTTALAWLWFRESRVDRVVLETGLGGRLDATNLCRPIVTVITPISLDHMQQLGATVAAIAAEKAGILKPGVPVINGAHHPDAIDVVQRTAGALGVVEFLAGRDLGAELVAHEGVRTLWTVRTPHGRYERIPLRLWGRHQGSNLALALTAFDLLRQNDPTLGDEGLRDALEHLTIPARQEVVQERPLVMIDSCHNSASAASLAATLASAPLSAIRKRLIFASSRDKDYADQLRILLPHFDAVILTQYRNNPRACALSDLATAAREISPTIEILVCESSREALRMGLARSREDEALMIAGSFYLAGELRAEF